MALLRVTRSLEGQNEEIILNTAHIVVAFPDRNNPARGSFVQMVTGTPILVKMTFDELWQLIQRET
ncbi:MAG TPA: hypothetical protein VEH27_20075 [Methylomirabilota bacterium]|nr:hypothetical protein [Methylomirabilota bacterium]